MIITDEKILGLLSNVLKGIGKVYVDPRTNEKYRSFELEAEEGCSLYSRIQEIEKVANENGLEIVEYGSSHMGII